MQRITWSVPGSVLESTNNQKVSPSFTVDLGPTLPGIPFKMMLFPTNSEEKWGGRTFKKAKGKARIQVKCECESAEQLDVCPPICFRLSAGGESRGPVRHSFRENATSGLPAHQEEWDFKSMVGPSGTFEIKFEVQPS